MAILIRKILSLKRTEFTQLLGGVQVRRMKLVVLGKIVAFR